MDSKNIYALVLENERKKLFDSIESLLSYTDHPLEKGRMIEAAVINSLKLYFPSKMGIGTGFVQSSSKQSTQQDIIIFDSINHTPLFRSDALSIFPIEMVLGCIEVKSKINKKLIRECMIAYQKLRSLPPASYKVTGSSEDNVMTIMDVSQTTPPRYYIVAHKSSWKDILGFKKALEQSSIDIPKSHLHGVYCIEKDWLGIQQHQARGGGFKFYEKNAFAAFIHNVILGCTDLISPLQINIDKYMADK